MTTLLIFFKCDNSPFLSLLNSISTILRGSMLPNENFVLLLLLIPLIIKDRIP